MMRACWRELLATEINYPHVNGNPELREHIARLYDGASVPNVLVTVGAAEANNVIMQTMMRPGDELVTQTPTYKQVWGLADNAGHAIKSFRMLPDQGWALDIEDLNAEGVGPDPHHRNRQSEQSDGIHHDRG